MTNKKQVRAIKSAIGKVQKEQEDNKCPRCDGTGNIWKRFSDGDYDWAKCPDCQGTGKKPSKQEKAVPLHTPQDCHECAGKYDGCPGTCPDDETPRAPEYNIECPQCHDQMLDGECSACGYKYPAPKEPDGIMKYISNDYANGHIIRELQAEIDALTQKVAELEGCLSGDPHLTATKEEREHWRHCAILYSNKLEQKVKDLEAEIKKKDEELMVRDKALELMAGHTIKVDWYLKQAKKLLIKKDASKKPDDKCSKCANNGIECLTCWAIIGEDADDNFKPKRKGIGKK